MQPAPHAEFRVGQLFRRRLPVGQTAGAGNGVGGQAAAGVRGDQAEAVDAARCIDVVAQGEQAAERNAAQPDFLITLLAGRFENFGLQGGERRAARNCRKIEVDRSNVESELAPADGAEEAGFREILRRHVGAGQEHDQGGGAVALAQGA